MPPQRITVSHGMACGIGLLCALLAGAAPAAYAESPDNTADALAAAATLGRIRDAAMHSDWAWKRLTDLTDRIGPRLSGSPQLTAAVAQVADAMCALGAQVMLQPAKVPHWIRGEEQAELIEYPGRPAGITQRLHLAALGSSSATPPAGLTARVVVVHDFDELKARAGEVRGNVVLFASRFDQRLAENGLADVAYFQNGANRFTGPSTAAELGAAATLVRSVGGAEYRLPHTGVTVWKDKQSPTPAATLSAEDADLIDRLAASGPVTIKLLLTPRTLPDVDSNNVIADWPGREKPGEFVIVSGHLDSWDLATGATDDGVGVMAAAGVIEVLRQLDLHPRRTIRFVAWTNEENGGHGSKAYFASVANAMQTQIAAIESDEGAGRALGVSAAVTLESLAMLAPVMRALGPIGATSLSRHDGELGADIGPLQNAGVPGFAPTVDARHYFDYHHTAADTLDKVNPENLRSQVATMAVLAWYLADMPEPLPRFSVADRM
ncbi:MAG: M20/M25/M40 family metallo-hydrolase [Steroidobacterales bacterium]